MFLGASIMRRTNGQKMSNTFSTVDMYDERTGHSMRTQHCTDERNIFVDSGEMCSDIAILSLALVLAHETSTPHLCTVD